MTDVKRCTIGCDPEFFMLDKVTGKVVSAVGKVPGSKEQPHIMKSGAGLQTDNVAIEFASAPAKNGEELVAHLRNTFKELIDDYVPENHSLFLTPSSELDKKELASDQALRFGCSASYDAWELIENPQPTADNTSLRSIGAHIHIGKTAGDGNDFLLDPMGKVYTIRALDCTLGLIDVLMDSSKEAVDRRKLYGKASEHRPKEYGVEYRSLGPWWMSTPQATMLVDAVVQDALQIVREKKLDELINALGGKDSIVTTINTGDIEQARNMIYEVVVTYLSEESKEYLDSCLEVGITRELSAEWFV